jgi:hypothetical protein
LQKLKPLQDTTHPLTRYLDAEPKPFVAQEFVLDGLIEAGTVLMAGSAGAGKTTALVPLMCRVAHLCADDDPLRPLLKRTVVYVSEDVGQVRRILRSMRLAGEFDGISEDEVAQSFKLVEAQRMSPFKVIEAASEFAELATLNTNPANGQTFLAQALIVLDTRSAVLAIENENDNSEAAAAIATLRQGLPHNPLLIVGHIAKALGRSDVANLSGRGAGAWEADAQQIAYLVKDDGDIRWLDIATPKHRFVAKADGLELAAHRTTVMGVDQLGNPVEVALMHTKPTVLGLGERRKAREAVIAAQERGAEAAAAIALRGRVLVAVQTAMNLGERVNKRYIRDKLGGKVAAVVETINRMIAEEWLVEVDIPMQERTHKQKKTYLVCLNDDQRRAFQATAVLPPEVLIEAPKTDFQDVPE